MEHQTHYLAIETKSASLLGRYIRFILQSEDQSVFADRRRYACLVCSCNWHPLIKDMSAGLSMMFSVSTQIGPQFILSSETVGL